MESENPLTVGRWRLWPRFAVCGPGFPASGMLSLAPDGLAGAADALPAEAPLAGGPRWDAFVASFDTASVTTALTVREIADRPAFRTAVAWSDPALTPPVEDCEDLAAHHWQRLATRSAGGPIGWGGWDPSIKGVEVDQGVGLVASSEVSVAGWVVDVLARAVDSDPALRAWIPPRRVPFVRVSGSTVSVAGRPTRLVPPATRELLALCDGTRTVADLAEALSARRDRPVGSPAVVTTLAEMVARRWIVWRLEVPAGPDAYRSLRAALDAVGDPATRATALSTVDVVERGLDRVVAAGRDAGALPVAVAALRTDLEGLTSGTRGLPDRPLVHLDRRRSATARVGTAVLGELAPLALCLDAARWLAGRFASAIAGHVRHAYRRLLARDGSVDLGSLWFECLPAPHREAVTEVERLQGELRERWAGIVAAPPGASHVQLSSMDIAVKLGAAFAEPGPGWPGARYASPRLRVAATSVEAVERGEFSLVLDALPVATNTAGTALFLRQHPDPAELLDQTTVDFPGPRLLPMPARPYDRDQPALVRPCDYQVALADHTVDPRRPRTVLGADVTVSEQDGRLAAVLPDGTVFDLLDVFGEAMSARVADRFGVTGDDDHTPRVTIDRLTVARETWRIAPTRLTFAEEPSQARRFVLARRWRARTGLPRFVVVDSPAEPVFTVDFDSPVSVNILAGCARRLAAEVPHGRLTVTEMLPTPDQAWLTDDAGNAYLSELRLIAVDQQGAGT